VIGNDFELTNNKFSCNLLKELETKVPEFLLSLWSGSFLPKSAASDGFWACRSSRKEARYFAVNAEAEPCMFTTTRWSLVLAGANSDSDTQRSAEALAELCRTYWRPVFSYVCRRGHSPDDAQDITQDFFLMVLKTNWLQQADRERGRFRSLLLKSVQNFLHNFTDTKQTLKRGGRIEFVRWDAWMAEAASQISMSPPAIGSLQPERLFDFCLRVKVR
jgi:hypothetical protein